MYHRAQYKGLWNFSILGRCRLCQCDNSGISHHPFADDKQLFNAVTVADMNVARKMLEKCVGDVQTWCAVAGFMMSLQLNAAEMKDGLGLTVACNSSLVQISAS